MIFSLDFPAGFTRTITANALSAILFYNNTSEKHYNSTITQTAILCFKRSVRVLPSLGGNFKRQPKRDLVRSIGNKERVLAFRQQDYV